MTPAERERFARRVDVLRAKGFPVTEEIAPRRTADVHPALPAALRPLVPASQNPWLSSLGWRRDDLPEAA